MSLGLINSSIVFITEDHIPSVNHDFLVNQKIIPEDFQKKGNSISTPVISQIYYDNGFTVIIEPNKTLIQFQTPNIEESENLENLNTLKDIASKYVEFFKTLKYQAIGLNFDFIKGELQYDSFIQKIIKEDNPLRFEDNKGEVRNIELSYSLKGKQFNIKVLKVESRPPVASYQSPTSAPLFQFNVHYPQDYDENKTTIIEELKENYDRVKKFIEDF